MPSRQRVGTLLRKKPLSETLPLKRSRCKTPSGRADPASRTQTPVGAWRRLRFQLRGAQIRRPFRHAQRHRRPAVPKQHLRAPAHGPLPRRIAPDHANRRPDGSHPRAGIDEAYLDLSALCQAADADASFLRALPLARALKQRIHSERRLTATIGVAANKLLAKIASDHQKPDGLTLIPELWRLYDPHPPNHHRRPADRSRRHLPNGLLPPRPREAGVAPRLALSACRLTPHRDPACRQFLLDYTSFYQKLDRNRYK